MAASQFPITLFPRCSTNVLIGTSNCGKSVLLKTILKHHKLYFGGEVPSGGVTVVYCNPKTPRWGGSDVGVSDDGIRYIVCGNDQEGDEEGEEGQFLELEEYTLEEFELDLVRPHSVLIFEDVSTVHDVIKQSINVGAHHIPLLSVFLVTQNLTGGSDRHFELSQICHRILFCVKTTSASSSCKQTISRFFPDADMKAYLESIRNFCQRRQAWMLLEMNAVGSHVSPFIAFSHLQRLAPDPFFPSDKEHMPYLLAHLNPYSPWDAQDIKSRYTLGSDVSLPPDLVDMATSSQQSADADMFQHTLVCVPFKAVVDKAAAEAEAAAEEDDDDPSCSKDDRAKWERVRKIIMEDIELKFKSSDWRKAKNLATDIMNCKMLCVTDNGKFLYINPDMVTSDSSSAGGRSFHFSPLPVPPYPPPPHRPSRSQRRKFNKWLKLRERQLKKQQHRHTAAGRGGAEEPIKVNVISFINDAMRQVAPSEKMTQEWKHYRLIVKLLVDSGTSSCFIKNSLLKGGRR